MRVRRWEYTDNLKIAEIEKKCFVDPWNFRMLTESFLLDNFVGYVLCDGEEVKGYIGCTYCLDEAEILLVAVEESERRKGNATELLSVLEERLCELGVGRMLLEVRRSNEAAKNCYLKYGFEFLAERKRYYADFEDALVMEKKTDRKDNQRIECDG